VIERATNRRNYQSNPPTFSHFVSLSRAFLRQYSDSSSGKVALGGAESRRGLFHETLSVCCGIERLRSVVCAGG
jgi:hypothetical protein